MFIAFLKPEIQSAINRSLPTPPTNVKRLEQTNLYEVFANSWLCFTKGPCLNFGCYPMSIACLQAEIDTGKHNYYVRKSRINKFTSFVVAFHVGAYFCMGAYKHDVVVVI